MTEIAFLVTMNEEGKTAKHMNRVVCKHASRVFCASFVTRLIHLRCSSKCSNFFIHFKGKFTPSVTSMFFSKLSPESVMSVYYS